MCPKPQQVPGYQSALRIDDGAFVDGLHAALLQMCSFPTSCGGVSGEDDAVSLAAGRGAGADDDAAIALRCLETSVHQQYRFGIQCSILIEWSRRVSRRGRSLESSNVRVAVSERLETLSIVTPNRRDWKHSRDRDTSFKNQTQILSLGAGLDAALLRRNEPARDRAAAFARRALLVLTHTRPRPRWCV